MRRKNDKYTKHEVKIILERAGKTIGMLPNHGTRPAGYGSGLPEHLIEFSDLIGAPKKNKLTLRPTQDQMSELELVFDWLVDLSVYCKNERKPYLAKNFSYGILRYPDSGKKIYNWRKLGKKMGVTGVTAKSWYMDAEEILIKILHGKSQLNNSLEDSMTCFTWYD